MEIFAHSLRFFKPASVTVSDPRKFSMHMPAEHGNSLNLKGRHPDTKPGVYVCVCVCGLQKG